MNSFVKSLRILSMLVLIYGLYVSLTYLDFNILNISVTDLQSKENEMTYFTNGSEQEYDIEKLRENRMKTMQDECRRRGHLTHVPLRRNVIVDDKHKAIFCYLAKVGSSQWKKLFLLMSGRFEDPNLLNFGNVHRRKMEKLQSFTEEEINYRLKHYTKAMIVRNPLERLLSAYRNKFTGKGFAQQFKRIALDVIKKFRKNITEEDLITKHITFAEFLDYVISGGQNNHWAEYTKMCSPCHVGYNFIGKFETIQEDADDLLERIRAPKNIIFPKRTERYTTKKTADIMQEFYSNITMDKLTQVWKRYKDDFDIFGYSVEETVKAIKMHK